MLLRDDIAEVWPRIIEAHLQELRMQTEAFEKAMHAKQFGLASVQGLVIERIGEGLKEIAKHLEATPASQQSPAPSPGRAGGRSGR